MKIDLNVRFWLRGGPQTKGEKSNEIQRIYRN